MRSLDQDAPGAWVTVGRYASVHEAFVVKGSLESHGVDVQLRDAETVAVDWLLSNALGGVRVQVKPAALRLAREILGGGDPELRSSEEDAEPARGVEAEANEQGKRILVAALLGFLVPLIPNLYSLLLLGRFARQWSSAPGPARLWATAAGAIDLLVLGGLVALVAG